MYNKYNYLGKQLQNKGIRVCAHVPLQNGFTCAQIQPTMWNK